MTLQATIPQPQTDNVVIYQSQDPTDANAPGNIVPPSVLPILMTSSTTLTPKPSAAPPHPQISQVLTAIPLGYQFAFNQLVSPTPYGNVIAAYRIYRNKTSNNFSGSTLIRTIIHDPTHQGAVTVQDSTGGSVQYYYFVTAVDSTGQESSQPGSFQASAITSGTANPNVATAIGVTSSPSTAITTYAVIPEMTLTVTTHGNKVLILFTGSFFVMNAAFPGFFAIFRDGAQLSPDYEFTDPNVVLIALSWLDNPSAGSHTFDARWKCNTATEDVNAFMIARSIQLVELG